MKTQIQTVDEYIAFFPEKTQVPLRQIRQTIRKAAPEAEETISYQMPAYRQNGILVYFAAFKSHIGFFPTPEGVEAFKEKLQAYKTSKGAIRFPLSEPLPLELIGEIVRFRVKQNLKVNI
ncbi:MAG: DUF1801 domain-containing protein [Candidatus Bathyarchaeota archaeon]|nr:DUF1801 domain-containing protein [Candidatus Bathyarchaeota archaeon]